MINFQTDGCRHLVFFEKKLILSNILLPIVPQHLLEKFHDDWPIFTGAITYVKFSKWWLPPSWIWRNSIFVYFRLSHCAGNISSKFEIDRIIGSKVIAI